MFVVLQPGWGWWGARWDPMPWSRLFLQSISGSDWLNTVAAGDITGELVAAVLPDLAINPLNVKRSSDRRFVRGRCAQQGLSATRVGLGRVGDVFLGRWKSILSWPQGLCCPTHVRACVCGALPTWAGGAWWGRVVAAALALGMGPLGLGSCVGQAWPCLSPTLMAAPPSSPLLQTCHAAGQGRAPGATSPARSLVVPVCLGADGVPALP